MAESPKEYQVQEGGWRNYLALLSFSYRTFIAPWPPFALFVIAIAALALVTPTLVVYATTGLVDAVTQDPASPDDSIFELVGLFLPWLGLLLVLRAITGLLGLDPLHRFMGLKLGLSSMKRLGDSLFGKAVSLRLEWFEYPRNYDGCRWSAKMGRI